MKTGTVFRDPYLRWYEPQHSLIGGESYFTHAWGSIYVLSGHAASTLALISSAAPTGLRFFSNEGELQSCIQGTNRIRQAGTDDI